MPVCWNRCSLCPSSYVVHGALWLLDQLIGEGIISKPQAYGALTFMLKAKARLPKEECEYRLHSWGAGFP